MQLVKLAKLNDNLNVSYLTIRNIDHQVSLILHLSKFSFLCARDIVESFNANSCLFFYFWPKEKKQASDLWDQDQRQKQNGTAVSRAMALPNPSWLAAVFVFVLFRYYSFRYLDVFACFAYYFIPVYFNVLFSYSAFKLQVCVLINSV